MRQDGPPRTPSTTPTICTRRDRVHLRPAAPAQPRNELLLDYIRELGYDVDFKTSLAKLEKDETGRITGVIAQSTEDDHFIRYNANKGVLLACGGFPGNPYMMEQLDPLGTSVTTACSYSPADKGYGIRAAVWAGANFDKEAAPMLFDRGIVAPGVDGGYVASDSAFGGKAFPGPIRQYNPGTQPFLKVNRNGERFANESSPYNDIVYAAAHQPGRVYAQICDANILEDAKRFHTIGCSAQTRAGGEKYFQGKVDEAVAAGTLFVCNTIEELADKLGFTGEAKDTFLATVDRYNELYDKQEDEDFGKPAYRLSAIRTAPSTAAGWVPPCCAPSRASPSTIRVRLSTTTTSPCPACTSPAICPVPSSPTTTPA